VIPEAAAIRSPVGRSPNVHLPRGVDPSSTQHPGRIACGGGLRGARDLRRRCRVLSKGSRRTVDRPNRRGCGVGATLNVEPREGGERR
jgi:hypothetical protein